MGATAKQRWETWGSGYHSRSSDLWRANLRRHFTLRTCCRLQGYQALHLPSPSPVLRTYGWEAGGIAVLLSVPRGLHLSLLVSSPLSLSLHSPPNILVFLFSLLQALPINTGGGLHLGFQRTVVKTMKKVNSLLGVKGAVLA